MSVEFSGPTADAAPARCACGATKPQDKDLCRSCWLRREVGAVNSALGGIGTSRFLGRPYHRVRPQRRRA